MKKVKSFFFTLIIAVAILGVLYGAYKYLYQAEDHNVQIQEDYTEAIQEKADSVETVVEVPMPAAEEIPADIIDGSVFFMVEVNGIPMKFMLDTGCNNMTISYIEYLFLNHQGRISKQDTKYGEITLADGSKRGAIVLNIDSIRIGSTRVDSVTCTVLDIRDSVPQNLVKNPGELPLLIGGEVLMKMNKRLSIDYKNKKIILENT